MADDSNDCELPDLVAKLREDLQLAMKEGEGEAVKFKLESIELELKVVAKKTGDGRTGIKFWVLNAEGGRKIENEHTQTIKLKMVPKLAETDGEGNEDVLLSKKLKHAPR